MQYDDAQMHMKQLLYLITLLPVFLAAPVSALQLSEINPNLTRTEADRSLSKDYTYKVLDDFTVRRSWVISDNRRVSLDFNPQNEKLLMIMVEYGSGVDQQKAAADVRRITGAGKTKWKRMDKKKAQKYDVPPNSHNAKSGSCFAFLEMSKSNKCKRALIYTSLPDSNRSRLGMADTGNSHETALGTRGGASIGKVIAQQEAERKSKPLAVNTASDSSAGSPAQRTAPVRAAADSPSRSRAETVKKSQTSADSGAVAVADAADDDIVDDFEEIKVESRFSLSALQASIGLQGVSPAMLIIGAVVVVVLLTLIGMLRNSGKRKRLARYRSGRY